MKGQAVRGREMADLDFYGEGRSVHRYGYRGDHSPGSIRAREARVVGSVRRPADSAGRDRVRVTPRTIATALVWSYGTNTYKRIIITISTSGIAAAAILIVDAVKHGR